MLAESNPLPEAAAGASPLEGAGEATSAALGATVEAFFVYAGRPGAGAVDAVDDDDGPAKSQADE